jgi:hypothetical protein
MLAKSYFDQAIKLPLGGEIIIECHPKKADTLRVQLYREKQFYARQRPDDAECIVISQDSRSKPGKSIITISRVTSMIDRAYRKDAAGRIYPLEMRFPGDPDPDLEGVAQDPERDRIRALMEKDGLGEDEIEEKLKEIFPTEG